MRKYGSSLQNTGKKIWIDLENSPHVPFFRPIINELRKREYRVLVTARKCFQVTQLADLFQVHYVPIGRHYGKNKCLKILGLLIRCVQLANTVLREKPSLALSHGSRSQVLLASMLGIPSVGMFDYEHTQTLVVVKPTFVIVPELIPDEAIKLDKKSIYRYTGIKEDVYVPNFDPDPEILNILGLSDKDLVVTVRPPAAEAHYHNPQSEVLLQHLVDYLCRDPQIRLVVLPRNEKQAFSLKKNFPHWYSDGRIIIPSFVVDGLNLIWHSDLVISGGGTMNREAAALGVPVYTIFLGKVGAIDRYLAEIGRLTFLRTVEDIETKIRLEHRKRPSAPQNSNTSVLQTIIDHLVGILSDSIV